MYLASIFFFFVGCCRHIDIFGIGSVVAVIQCLQYYYYFILQSYFENYLISQHSTEAPLDHVSTLYSTDGASDTFVDYQIFNVKRQINGFPQVLIIFITTMI